MKVVSMTPIGTNKILSVREHTEGELKDLIIREKHPFDDGYWARYDGKPRPETNAVSQEGWDTCDAELKFEAENRQ